MLHVQCTVDTLATYKLLPGMSCYMFSALLTHWQHTSCYLACHVTCSVHCCHSHNIQVVTWHSMLHVQCTVDTVTTYKLLPGISCYMFSALLTQWQHTSHHLEYHATFSVHCFKLSLGMSRYMFSALLTQWQHTSHHLEYHATFSVHCWHSDNIQVAAMEYHQHIIWLENSAL